MAARVFSPMARVIARTFREPGTHYWQRHDADAPVAIDLIFNEAPELVDEDGVRIADIKAIAYVRVDDALAAAPERADVDRRELFSNRDTLTINGTEYRVESCRPDGLGILEILLYR